MGSEKKMSCVINLLDFNDRVSSALDVWDGWEDCVFLDCQKVFDYVKCKMLLKKPDFQASEIILVEGNKDCM